MTYKEISKACEELSYRDKFRLAQLLIQLARKEEEEQYPEARIDDVQGKGGNGDDQQDNSIEYIAERLLKLKPSKKKTLLNSIGAMFQFQGGISEEEKEKVIQELQKKKYIKIEQNNRVMYL